MSAQFHNGPHCQQAPAPGQLLQPQVAARGCLQTQTPSSAQCLLATMTPVGFHGPRLPAGSCESRPPAHFGTSWFPEPQEAPMAPGSQQTLAIPDSMQAPKNPGFLLSPASGLLLCTQAFDPPQHEAASHGPRPTCHHSTSLVSKNLQTRPANLGSQSSLGSGQPHSPSIQTSSQGFRLLACPRARPDPTDQTSRLTPEVIG